MNGKKILLLFIVIVFTACENGNEPHKSTIIEGETTLKTDSLPCFSFRAGKAFGYPSNENQIADFFALVCINETGRPTCLGLFANDDSETFAYIYPKNQIQPDNLDTALLIFDTLSILDNDLYYTHGICVEQGQVFAVKTKENKYGLMVITDAKYYRDTTDTLFESYEGYVTFKWKYQTNGSRSFDN